MTKAHFRPATTFAILLIILSFSIALQADEGMWTFDNFPSSKVAKEYGFNPSQAWLDHVRLASLRIAGGCSASFISPYGLVMTNHHCVVECLQQLSSARDDLSQKGYIAKTQAEERKCPDFELDQLVKITDVTTDVHSALSGKTGHDANKALDAKRAELQQSCGTDKSFRCDLVSLYHGGIYKLYRYKRYNDVRLVFAPEFSVAQFGGDPDNFNFPRFDFDVSLVRAYENDKPLSSPEYLHWSPNGTKDGDLVFVSGNPGGTSRELTMSQLAFLRDTIFPFRIPEISELRGQLEEFITHGPEQSREASDDLFFLENTFKVYYGRQAALLDPQFMAQKQQAEDSLRNSAAKDPKLAGDLAAWKEIAEIQRVRKELYPRYMVTMGFARQSNLLSQAINLVRAAEERTKPNTERLPEYTDQALVNLQQEISAPIPIFKDLEKLNLALLFSQMRRDLGVDDPFVQKVLGKDSPEQLAERLVNGTQLNDPKVRESLYQGGQSAIASSQDPVIRFVAGIDPDLLAIRKEYEAKVDAPTRAAAERIAKARFAIYGTTIYPDATFTARLSFGAVKGFQDAQGKFVTPYTTIGGLFQRATGAPPFDLPQSWLDAKSSLDLSTPMNLSTTNDIIGGNSGSPLIDQNANVVGLIFDGNIFSLGGDYGFDAAKNRAVAVDSRALLEGMKKVYHLDRIVSEIEAARK